MKTEKQIKERLKEYEAEFEKVKSAPQLDWDQINWWSIQISQLKWVLNKL